MSPFLEASFKLKHFFILKITCLRKVNKRFLRFHGHITDCLSPLTSKNPGHKRPVSFEFSTSAVVTPVRLQDSQLQ